MRAIPVIERVVASGILIPELVVIPSGGATIEELATDASTLGRELSESHTALLRRWNGLNLDVIRLYGCGSCPARTGQLVRMQLGPGTIANGSVAFGSDPAGFVYVETVKGQIQQLDSDGGAISALAEGLDDFLCRVVFGKDAAAWGGDEWFQELRDAGLV